MKTSESLVNIAKAIVDFNSKVQAISKDGNNPFFKSKYVTLDKLIEETRPILKQCKLSVMQFPMTGEGGTTGVKTLLIHETGEFIEGEPLFLKPVKNDPQGMGSVVSYARRYAYQAILNLNTGEDDDGNNASFWTPNIPKLMELSKDKGFSVSQLTKAAQELGAKTLQELNKEQYENLYKRLSK